MRKILLFLLIGLISLIPSVSYAESSRDFNATSSLIDVGTGGSNGLTTITMAGWMKADTFGEGNQGRIIDNDSFTGDTYLLFITNTAAPYNNAFRASAITNATAATSASVDSTISTSTHTFLTMTYDNGAASRVVTLYKDGVEPSYREQIAATGTIEADSANKRIGNGSGSTRTFDGILTYIQRYNRVLSAVEVNEIMYKPGSIPDGLVGFWPIFGANNPEIDLSGNGNTGALTDVIDGTDGPPVMLTQGMTQ